MVRSDIKPCLHFKYLYVLFIEVKGEKSYSLRQAVGVKASDFDNNYLGKYYD